MPAVRAAVFAAVCTGLGAAAHLVMSATAIPRWALVLGAIGVYGPARLAANRERGLLEITLLMGVLQVGLHLLFDYAQHVAAPAPPMPMPMPMPAHGMSMPGMSMAGAGSDMRMSAGMLLGHSLAALVCAWWLRRGEAAAHALVVGAACRVGRRLAVLVHVVRVPSPQRWRLAGGTEHIALLLRTQWLYVTRVLRGPPLPPSIT